MKLVQWSLGRENRRLAVFSFLKWILELLMKTIVYIDGFNLYFGSLKGTPYRWLNILGLVKALCYEQNPHCNLVAIKYYTADIKDKLSPHGVTSCQAQQNYLLSIQAMSIASGIPLEIIKGKYNLQLKNYYAHNEPVNF